MKQYILIEYDPKNCGLLDSKPGCLYDYLVNELDNEGIKCRVTEYSSDPRHPIHSGEAILARRRR